MNPKPSNLETKNSTPPSRSRVRGFRDTFGIANTRTGKLYSDIIDYALVVTNFSDNKLLPNSVLNIHDTEYLIQLDSRLKRKLKQEGLVRVICSLQKRTTGNYCIARIYQPKENIGYSYILGHSNDKRTAAIVKEIVNEQP